MKNKYNSHIKPMKLKFLLRLFAMLDVLFADKFELTTWDKKGEQKSKTRFSKTEIDNLKK